ncbi:LacI family transcriptional regulator [Cytophagales bacterium WSM2-2]|nr:LacI family transcriptional regulator [Cytophagales bacterium WSM2-2]
MKSSQTTVRDIARLLNISVATVSRALRDHIDIKPETRKKVLELVEQLNYHPNFAAKSLRTNKTNTLGVVVPEIVMHFFSNTLSGIQEYAALHDYNIIVCQSMESARMEETNIQKLLANRVDGLIISLAIDTENVDYLRQLVDRNIPVLLFDRVSDDLEVSKVVVDDSAASFRAVEYLISTGCHRIAYIGGPKKLYVSREREMGYVRALEKNQLRIDQELIVHCKNLHTDPCEVTKHLLELREIPDAIFCMNDPIAIQVMQVLKEKQVRVPDDISVIGFTNEPVSSFIEPSLTTISQPSFEMGRVAASLIIDQLKKPQVYKPTTRVLETNFIIRNSTRKVEYALEH